MKAMKIECMQCGRKDNIEWNISCWKLKKVEIDFACKQCNAPGKIVMVVTKKKNKPKISVDWEETNYIG